jgi:hypothetical protein
MRSSVSGDAGDAFPAGGAGGWLQEASSTHNAIGASILMPSILARLR